MTLLRAARYGGRALGVGALRYGWQGLVLCICVLGASTAAGAQEAPQLRPHHVTFGANLVWAGSYDIGDATAQLRGNAPGATAPPFTLFTASSRIRTATAPAVLVGVALTRRVAIEAGASLSHPRIGVAIGSDPEVPTQELPGERLDQYQFDLGLTWQLPLAVGSRLAPFVVVGGGYLRQLHEDRTLAETGQIYFGGAGARYWLRGQAGRSLALGFRADARINVRRQGIDFENKTRLYPAVSLGLFLGL